MSYLRQTYGCFMIAPSSLPSPPLLALIIANICTFFFYSFSASPDRLFISCAPPTPSFLWARMPSSNQSTSNVAAGVSNNNNNNAPLNSMTWKRVAIVGDLAASEAAAGQTSDPLYATARPHASVSGDGAYLVTASAFDRLAKIWKLPDREAKLAAPVADPSELPAL